MVFTFSLLSSEHSALRQLCQFGAAKKLVLEIFACPEAVDQFSTEEISTLLSFLTTDEKYEVLGWLEHQAMMEAAMQHEEKQDKAVTENETVPVTVPDPDFPLSGNILEVLEKTPEQTEIVTSDEQKSDEQTSTEPERIPVRVTGKILAAFAMTSFGAQEVRDSFDGNYLKGGMELELEACLTEKLIAKIFASVELAKSPQLSSWKNGEIDAPESNTRKNSPFYAEISDQDGKNFIRTGRQHVEIGDGLNGKMTADGVSAALVFGKTTVSGGVFCYQKSDKISLQIDKPDFIFCELEFLLDDLSGSLTAGKDQEFRMNSPKLGIYSLFEKNPFAPVPGISLSSVRVQDQIKDSKTGYYSYYGATFSGNVSKNLRFLTEYSILRWENPVMVGNSQTQGGEAFSAGLHYRKEKSEEVIIRWSRHGDFFIRPDASGIGSCGFCGDDALNLGYYYDFDELFAGFSHALNEKLKLEASYRRIRDNRDLPPGILQDHRQVSVTALEYAMTEDSSLRLGIKKVSAQSSGDTEQVSGVCRQAGRFTGNVYQDSDSDGINDFKDHNGLLIDVSDVSLIFLEMSLKI